MTLRPLPALSLAFLLPCHPLLAQSPAPTSPDGRSSTAFPLPHAPHIIAANDRDTPLVLDAERAFPTELLLLGFDIHASARAARDLWALAAGEFSLDGPVAGDLRTAAKAVKLAAPVGGNLLAIANGIQFLPSSSVVGESLLRANRVYTDGAFVGDVLLYAPEIRLGGTFSGNVSCPVATSLHILPGTRVDGTLSYPDTLTPSVPADAAVAALSPIPADAAPADLPTLIRRRLRVAAAFWLSFLLLGLPLFRFFPLRTAAALQLLHRRPLACALTGLFASTFSALPLVLLAITGYALPLAFCSALLLLCFALASIPLLALPLGQLFLGRHRVGAPPPGFASLALGLLALALPLALMGLPGTLFVMAAATLPFGAFILTVFHPVVVLHAPCPPAPPPAPNR